MLARASIANEVYGLLSGFSLTVVKLHVSDNIVSIFI